MRVNRLIVAGHDCWRVTADDALSPSESDWSFEYDGGQSYLVETEGGQCIGVGLINGYTLVVPDKA